MHDLINYISDILDTHGTVIWTLSLISLATILLLLFVVPWLIVRLPADYLTRPASHRRFAANHHPAFRLFLFILRNAFGAVLLIAGIVMLVIPGQGVLTILAGLVLLTFPGKHRLLHWLISRPTVLRTINWLRRKAHRLPLRT